MRSREPIRLSISLAGAIVAAGIFLNAHAAFADDGDEMCSKAGQLWVDDLETRAWQNIGGHCTPRGPNGPANGDRRCGASGFDVKYVAKIDRWLNTHTPCHGGSNDVHLEDLHTGSQSATPSGWGGLHNPAPGGM
jgi:hypothetical protein